MCDEIKKNSISKSRNNVLQSPSKNSFTQFFDGIDSEFKCPACGNVIRYGDENCKKCGQKFYWKM